MIRLLLALALLLPAGAFAQTVSSRAEPAEVSLGQPFVYVVEVRHEAGERWALPKPLELGTLGVRGVEVSRTETGTTFRISAAVYDVLGQATIPELVLRSGARTLTVPGVALAVKETGEGDELQDISGPAQALIFDGRWAYGAGALLAAGLLTFLAVRLARRLRERPAAPPAPVPLGPPDVRALAALDELAAAGLPLQPHYFRLSEIVRGYLQEVGGVPALDMTSSELVAALELRPVPGLSLPVLHAWLERGDVVRYANLFLVDEEVVADLEEARILIRDVAAALAPPPAEAAAG